jgi:Leucine-rich repeat (LRR) protein
MGRPPIFKRLFESCEPSRRSSSLTCLSTKSGMRGRVRLRAHCDSREPAQHSLRQPGACPALQQLRPSFNQIGDEGARALAEALRQPGACPALQQLDLSFNQIGDEGARALAEALRQPGACPALQQLDLLTTRLGMRGRVRWRRLCDSREPAQHSSN